MATTYIITKASRLPDLKDGSYSGITFDLIGREKYKAFYDSKKEAMNIAHELYLKNPVGFRVYDFKGNLVK